MGTFDVDINESFLWILKYEEGGGQDLSLMTKWSKWEKDWVD